MNTCNEKAIIETIIETGESAKTVESVIQHYSFFIASRIREGKFESVRIPYFGTFKAKLREIQFRSFILSLPKSTHK